MALGPNVKRLIVHKMSLTLVPPGGGLAEMVANLAMAGRLSQAGKEATEWVQAAIAAVKAAPDNPHGDDDEAIAGAIMQQVEARLKARRGET